MQTFLPVPLFDKSARLLDYRRLGKQRVEAMQIYNILIGKATSNAWKHHPAVLMWKGCEDYLAYYYNSIRYEWISRGFVNNMLELVYGNNFTIPKWLGDKQFHASHRSNLLRKDFNFYSKYGWKEPIDLPYIWPI